MKSKIFSDKSLLKNTRGISVVIGYILLIGIAMAMSVGVYQLMKSYTPKDSPECPDGVSIFVKDYECASDTINLTLKNSGRFNIAGYFIHVSDNSAMSLATIDLSQNLISDNAQKMDNGIKFFSPLEPTEETENIFSTTGIGDISSVEIIPIRIQKEGNKELMVTCSNALSKNEIAC